MFNVLNETASCKLTWLTHWISEVTSCQCKKSCLICVASSYGLHPVITEPTRVTSTSCSLIDHVYASSSSLMKSSCVLPPLGSSDHNSIEICLSITKPHQHHPRCRIWLYKCADFKRWARNFFTLYRTTLMELAQVYTLTEPGWPSSMNTNRAWLTVKDTVTKAMRKFIPK